MALDFLVRLQDGASGPANRAAAAVSRLRQQMRALTGWRRPASRRRRPLRLPPLRLRPGSPS